MTENEKKLLDQVLSEAALYGRINGTVQDLVRAVQMERISEAAKEAYLLAAVRYKREQNAFYAICEELRLPDFVKSELLDRAEELAKAAPDLDEQRGAMTPEKLKAYTGRDFDR